jgi:integrase
MGTSFIGKVTVSAVKALKPGDELRDRELRGFGVRCQERAISYFVQAKIDGRLKRLTIGRHGSPWTPETARIQASKLLLAIKSGQDPAQERDERRQRGESFAVVGERFLELHGSKLRATTLEIYRTMWRNQLKPTFGTQPIDAIRHQDVSRAHTAWGKTPRTANHALSMLSKLMNWAEANGYRKKGSNPCGGIKRYKENKRERYLTEAELARLGNALAQAEANGLNPYVIATLRLLLLTGARLNEILTLRWQFVDLVRQQIRLPDSKTGPKTLLLNEPAVAVLRSLPRLENNPWVLPGHIQGSHLVAVEKPWYALRKKAEIPDVRLHDLRHSFASVAVDAGGSLPIIGRLLGHGHTQTTARYAHVGVSPAQALSDRTAAVISAALDRSSSKAKPLPFLRWRTLRQA